MMDMKYINSEIKTDKEYQNHKTKFQHFYNKGKVQKKGEKKLASVSFMYVCVAGNGEMLFFSPFFPQQ